MIIFYNRITGNIVGNIQGRYHSAHKDMWIGDPAETDRIIMEWLPVLDLEGNPIEGQMKWNHGQGELIVLLEDNPSELYKYKVDINNKTLIYNG